VAKKTFISLVESGTSSGAKTLIERTYAQLREDILTGSLAPGEKLLVEHLKDRYNVGAGTLREALSRLVSEAMVVAEGQRGFTVPPMAIEDLIDITNVRVSLEIEALRASIRNGDEFWRKRLASVYESLSRLEQPLLRENVKLWEQANVQFHEALLSACGSPWTLRVLRQLSQHAERYRRFSIDLQSGRNVHEEHEQIFEFAMRGQDARAALALEAHIRATPEALMRAVESGADVFHRKHSGA
jgi:DNA-binding GntR family transcriptional regulator